MLAVLRSNWRMLKRGSPGTRFQNMNRHRRATRKGSGKAQRVLTLVLGGLLVIGGPIAGLIPGPGGILISIFGWALLASELLVVARWLDWCEPRVRKLWGHVARAWKRATIASRIAVCAAGASLMAMLVLAVRSFLSPG